MVLSYTLTEEAKKFEDGLQEAKDFFSIQKKHVSNTFCVFVCIFNVNFSFPGSL